MQLESNMCLPCSLSPLLNFIFDNEGTQEFPDRINDYMDDLQPQLKTLIDNMKILGFLQITNPDGKTES